MRKYHSYLLRVWGPDEQDVQPQPTRRFVVETVSDPPHRWSFDSFPDLVAFLGDELRESAPVTQDIPPAQEAQTLPQDDKPEQEIT